MDETEEHPLGDEVRLASDDPQEQRVGGTAGVGLGIMSPDRVGGECAQSLAVVAGCEVLEGADTEMAGGDAREDGSRQKGFAKDAFACRNGCEGAGGGHAECGHSIAENVLAKNRAQGGAAVAPAGERCRAGALELDIVAEATGGDEFAEQVGAAVAELRNKVSELVAGIGLGERLGAVGDTVAGEQVDAAGGGEEGRIEA